MTEITERSMMTTELNAVQNVPTSDTAKEVIGNNNNDDEHLNDRDKVEVRDESTNSFGNEEEGDSANERKRYDAIPNFGYNLHGGGDTRTTISSIVVNDTEPSKAAKSLITSVDLRARDVTEGALREENDNDGDWNQNSKNMDCPNFSLEGGGAVETKSIIATNIDRDRNVKNDASKLVAENEIPPIGGSTQMIYHNKTDIAAERPVSGVDTTTKFATVDLAPWKVAAIKDVTSHKVRYAAGDPPEIEPQIEPTSGIISTSTSLTNAGTTSNGARLSRMNIASMSQKHPTTVDSSLKHQTQQHSRSLTNDAEIGSNEVNCSSTDSNHPGRSASEGNAAADSASERPLHRVFRRVLHSAALKGFLLTTFTTTVVTKTKIPTDPSLKVKITETSSEQHEQQANARKLPRGEFDLLNLEDDDDNVSSTYDETTGTNLDQYQRRHGAGDEDENSCNIAVAEPVTIQETTYLPAAVEYDAEHKYVRPDPERKRRRRFFQFGVIVVLLSIIIGTSVGISRHRNDDAAIANGANATGSYLSERENVGIYEMIIQNIPGTEGILQTNEQHPYTKAYRWIMYNDPLRTVPVEYPQFLQRYVLATLYYSTSQYAPWSVCTPPHSSLLPAVPSNAAKNSSIATGINTDDNSADADCITSEKFSTGKSSYNWLTSMDECLWAGVICDEGQNVQQIIIADMGLSGTIPEAVFQLPLIQNIELSSVSGNLTGTIPNIDSKCLNHFGVQNNFVTGSIPVSLLMGRSLLKVNLGMNLLTGGLRAFKRINQDMHWLQLENNKLDQSSLKYFVRLPSIKTLLIKGNQLTGTIPSGLLSSSSIRRLDLSDNLITGTIPDIQSSLTMQAFDVSNNQLTGTIPSSIYNQTLLDRLLLNNNDLNGTLSSDIQFLSNLGTFRVDRNPRLAGTIPTGIGVMTHLELVSFLDTSLTGQIPTELCNLRNLALNTLNADCYDPSDSSKPEIICLINCCTICCEPDGDNCFHM